MPNIETDRFAVSQLRTALGIEFGSTRIKAVLTGPDHQPLASGSFDWCSSFQNGIWSYDLDLVWTGLRGAYASLAADVEHRLGVELPGVGALGVSAMQHGYLVFDAEGELLVPFRTWQNTMTGVASRELSQQFGQNVPQRWSVAHLYQAILAGEPHVTDISYMTTLAGYVHWKLSGRQVLGVCDASGMFPIDPETGKYDTALLERFDKLIADWNVPWLLRDLLPDILTAGASAGSVTPDGALLIDNTGGIRPGTPLAPPEGDGGTGMVATNSVAHRTANISAGTSIFAMVVLERPLRSLHEEIDLITTPAGEPVAMAHCNNGARDLQAWMGLFGEVTRAVGSPVETQALFEALYNTALDGDPDGGGMLAYNYLAGEHVVGMDAGRPLFVRTPTSNFTLANFMRTNLFGIFGALRTGMDILMQDEGVAVDRIFAHGGLFKTKGVAQRFLAAAMKAPVSVSESAGEGGAWGMALLAAYVHESPDAKLVDWLEREVFADAEVETLSPAEPDVAGFECFMERYRAGLAIERAAIQFL